MKNLVTFFLLLFLTSTIAQEKVVTKTGKIIFEASVPSFEEVKAQNDGVTCLLNTKTGEISSLAMVKEFRFKLALMEEHFNDNYIESNRYPKSTFKGKIENFDATKLTDTYQEYYIKGKIELHGITKKITITAQIKKNSSGIKINSKFVLNSNDFEIKIPSVVKNKVSNTVLVFTEFIFDAES